MKNKNTKSTKKISRQTIDLSYTELKYVIEKHDLVISKDSLLYQLLDSEPVSSSIDTIGSKMLKKESDWHSVVSALCNPDFKVSSTIVYPDRVVSMNYCSNRSKIDTIIACLTKDERIYLSYPWEPNEILADNFTAIDINSAPYAEVDKMQFTFDGLVSFAAAVDSLRTIMLGSIISRKFISDFRLPIDHLDLMLQLSLEDKSFDARWLMTLVRIFTPHDSPLSNIELTKKGFNELVDLGLVINEEENQWSPTSKFLDLTSNWILPLPVVYHEVTVINPDEHQEIISSLILRGNGPICLIDFNKANENSFGIDFQILDPSSYWLLLMGRITPPKADKKQVPKSKPAYKCPSCGAMINNGQKFCTTCGNQLPEKLELMQDDTPQVKVCANCGAELKLDTKFCTKCGTKA